MHCRMLDGPAARDSPRLPIGIKCKLNSANARNAPTGLFMLPDILGRIRPTDGPAPAGTFPTLPAHDPGMLEP
jgi:hypothetical protein